MIHLSEAMAAVYEKDWVEAIQFNAVLNALRTVLSVDVSNYDRSMELVNETAHLIMTIMTEGADNVVYLDSVLFENETPVFNDTPEKVRSWLLEQPVKHTEKFQIHVGKTLKLLSIPEYLGLKG
jgi:hypothetical protein